MRRGLAGLVLGLALVLASVTWAAFIMSNTVLDPGRSERLADEMFENEELRGVLVARVADGMGATLPPTVVVSNQTLELAAAVALANPAVQQLVREGIVETHRAALDGQVEPVVIDGVALGDALRESLVDTNPELDSVLPPAPPVSLQLPTSGLNFLGTVKNFVDQFTILAAAAALIGASAAFVVTSDRPSVLRRVAFWAFGASIVWLVIGYGIPRLAALIGPASSALTTAAIDVFFGAMIGPAVILGLVGGALLALSLIWSSFAAQRPARIAQPKRSAPAPVQPQQPAASSPAPMRAPRPPAAQHQEAQHQRAQNQLIRAQASGSHTAQYETARPDTAQAQPAGSAKPGPGAVTRSAASEQPGPVWVAGIGYVDEDGNPISQEPS